MKKESLKFYQVKGIRSRIVRFKVEKEPRIGRDEYEFNYAKDNDESDISETSNDEEAEEEARENLTEETMKRIAELIKSGKDKHELSIDSSW